MASVFPFEDKVDNYFEIFGECMVMNITYTYMFFKQSFKANMTMGKVFMFLYVSTFSTNLSRILFNLVFNILKPYLKSIPKKYDE
jgi:hypothetical protein